MPEIDPDLYSILTLALLLVIALALVGIASTLGAIKKTLGALGNQLAATQGRATSGDDARPGAEASGAAAGAYGAAATAAPQEEAGVYRGYTPAEERAGGASPALGVEPAGEPSPASEPAATSAARGTSTAAAQPEPQEQPFERDGRWWFRRGDELLVYDERSSQWVAAPESGERTAPAASAAPGEGDTSEGGFWKCPSCGAVNGSTAATCRMCFTERP